MSGPLIPRYGSDTLSDVLPSIGAHLGVRGAEHRLDLPAGRRYVVFLIDGLGWELLQAGTGHAPYLASLMDTGRVITSGVPSTTVTSITSLATGLTPGQHGMAGYSFRYPQTGRVLNALLWEPGLDGLDVQPQLTYFERLAGAGVSVASVTPARFRDTGLTTAALRGPSFLGVEDENDVERRVELACQASLSGSSSVVYFYERELDHTGHSVGCTSREWVSQLERVDRIARFLRDSLDDEVRLIITADHGMLDIPAENQILFEDEPDLQADVLLFAGEGRLRQLHVVEGRGEAVAGRWRERLGPGAWVRTRDEAVAEGWFGPMNPRSAGRFGDVLVAMNDDRAVMSRALEKELSLVGMHGSLTPVEMRVPLLTE